MWQNKNASKNFDYTTIADRLRMISWSHDSHQTCVVELVYGIPTFPLCYQPETKKDNSYIASASFLYYPYFWNTYQVRILYPRSK